MPSTILQRLESGCDSFLERFKNWLAEMGDYEQPYFTLMHCKDVEALESILGALLDDVEFYWAYFGCNSSCGNEFMILCTECEVEQRAAFHDGVLQRLREENVLCHLAVFGHNCLGDAWETFSWATLLLEEAITQSPDAPHMLVNDFRDRDNWPGIRQYTNADPIPMYLLLQDDAIDYAESDLEHMRQIGRDCEIERLDGRTAIRFSLPLKQVSQLTQLLAPLFAKQTCSLRIGVQQKRLSVITIHNRDDVVDAGGTMHIDQLKTLDYSYIECLFWRGRDKVIHHAEITYDHMLRAEQDEHWALTYLQLPEGDDELEIEFRALHQVPDLKIAEALGISRFMHLEGNKWYHAGAVDMHFGPDADSGLNMIRISLTLDELADPAAADPIVKRALASIWQTNFNEPLYWYDEAGRRARTQEAGEWPPIGDFLHRIELAEQV